jgi:hypothetical protein
MRSANSSVLRNTSGNYAFGGALAAIQEADLESEGPNSKNQFEESYSAGTPMGSIEDTCEHPVKVTAQKPRTSIDMNSRHTKYNEN